MFVATNELATVLAWYGIHILFVDETASLSVCFTCYCIWIAGKCLILVIASVVCCSVSELACWVTVAGSADID